MAEEFNIRLSVDTSEGRVELNKWYKQVSETVKAGDRLIERSARKTADFFNIDSSISSAKKLTAQIAKLKKAAGDVNIRVQDSETPLAKAIESALKPSKAKGKSLAEIKKLQKELESIVTSPVESYKELASTVEGMRKIVSELRKPNPRAAKEYADTRRELEAMKRELAANTRDVRSGRATPQTLKRQQTLSVDIPKTEAKLKQLDSALKPTGAVKALLANAEKSLSRGMMGIERIGMALQDFSEGLEETTTGFVQGAGRDLLSGSAVRSLAKVGGDGQKTQLSKTIDTIIDQVVGQIVKPRMQSYQLSRRQQAKIQSPAARQAYIDAGGARVDKDTSDPTGVMTKILRIVTEELYPHTGTGTGTAVVFKGYGEKLAKVIEDAIDENEQSDEEKDVQEQLNETIELIKDAFEEMDKNDEANSAASLRGKKGLASAETAVKDAFGSYSVEQGDVDEQANRKELEAFVRRLLEEVSYGARGGKGGKRIGGTFVPVEWDGMEMTGGYMEGGWSAKDMNKGFFGVDEITAMQDGFQYATLTAQEFSDAMMVAIEVFNKIQKAYPEAKLAPFISKTVGEVSQPLPKLSQAEIQKWLQDNPQGFRPGVKLAASEKVFGVNQISKTISAIIDAVNKKVIDPTGTVSEINSVANLFEKLSPSMQNFIGLIEDFAVAQGKIETGFKARPGKDETMGLNLYGPQLNILEQLFNSVNTNPSTSINGRTYSGSNYPGVGIALNARNVLGLKIAEELKKDFAAIYGGDMMTHGGLKTTVDPRTFRPSVKDDAIEMKAIDAFIENRRAFIDYIMRAGNKLVIDDITMGLPNVENAFDKASYTRFGGPGASDVSYGDLRSQEMLYAQDPISTRGRAYSIFGGAKAQDAGVNTVEGIRKGLASGKQTLAIESKVLAETVVDGYEGAIEIKSPSRRMRKSGQDTIAGLELGLQDGESKIDAQGRKLADSFHRGYTEQERVNAAKRVQEMEKQGLTVPAAALRAQMSTAPTRDAASSATEIALRNKKATDLIDALAGVEGALIAFDDEKTAQSGMFGVSMVGGTGRGDTAGIYHNMVMPQGFKANRQEAEVLGLTGDPTSALKKRIQGLGYGPENIEDPGAQRKMAEDLAYLIKYAIDKNIPIAMHNLGYSDWNDVIKLMEKFQISGAPAREAASRGLLIETQGTAQMAGISGSKKLEELYTTLMGRGFGPYLRPKAGQVPNITDKKAVAHDPTIDASATLEIAFELKKILSEMGFEGKGIYGDIIKAIEGGWKGISELVLGARTHGGPGFAKKSNQFATKALSYKGVEGSEVVDPQAAMRDAQVNAKQAIKAAGNIERLTREERNIQIQQRLDIIQELKARLKALIGKTTGVASEAQLKQIAELTSKINQELADPTIAKEWNRRLATGGGGGGTPLSGSRIDQGFEGEAKARAVASKKIQGQMKDEMSVMADVERYNRKMMDSWISGRYALYDMANTYQQFVRAGMQVARFLKQAIMLNAQYETSFTAVERAMQPLTDEIGGMRNELVKLTTELPVAFDELSRIATLAAQMGINASEVTDFTKQVSQFGTVTGIATEEVASKFGSLTQLMHTATDPEGFKKLGSAVAYTGINAVATDQEILSLAESIASATTQAGFAADQTIGLSTALSSLRIAPEQARGVITRLFGDINRAVEGGGKPLQAYAKHLGSTTEEAQKMWRADPQAFFKKMLENVKNAENSTIALDALNIKETREVNTIQRLSENMDVYNNSMADAAEAYKNGTFLADAYAKTQDNIATKITLLQNQFKLLQDSIGKALEPITGTALELLTGLVDGLTEMANNPVGQFAVRTTTAIMAMTAGWIALTMAQQKATASMLAFRTGELALARMGGQGGIVAFLKQLTGQEVLIARSNGRIEVLQKKRLEQMKKLGEISEAPRGSDEAMAILANVDARRGQLESTEDIILQKTALRQATLDETNQDRLSTLEKDRNTRSRLSKARAAREEAVATAAANRAAASGGGERVAVVTRKDSLGLGGIVGKIGMIGMAVSLLTGIFAMVSEAIEGTKVNLEEAGGGLASFREAIYEDTRSFRESGEAISTYGSKVVVAKKSLNDWASGMATATGATVELTSDLSVTTDEISKQTLALGKNAQAWLAQAAAADTNVQDMFKKFYTVDGPGLGEMAAAAGTKISDIITSALAAPGTGATAFVEANFDTFATALQGRGAEVKDALLKIAKSLDSTTSAGVESSKMVKALNEGFKDLGESTDDVVEPVETVTERIRTLTDYVGDLSSITSSAFNIRFGKAEAVDKLAESWRGLRDKVKQAREEIANIQREINGMQADANILQYQLNIAIKYGDTLRADKLRAEIAAKQQEISNKNAEMVKAQDAASTSLVGNSEAAVQNRATLRGLVQDYNNYLAALANTAKFEGMSAEAVKQKKDYLKKQADQAKRDLIAGAKKLGFKESELDPYIASLNDFKTIVDKLPKELTLKVVADPATRAFMEWWSANKGNFNPTGGSTTGGNTTTEDPATGNTTEDGVPTVPGIKRTPFSKLPGKVEVSDAAKQAIADTSLTGMHNKVKKELQAFGQAKEKLGGVYNEQTANTRFSGSPEKFKQWKSWFDKYEASKAKLKKYGYIFKGSQGELPEAPMTGSLESVGGQADRAAALAAQPALVKEAIAFIKNGLTAREADNKAFESAKKPFADAKQRMGLAGDTAWAWILKNKKGQKHVDPQTGNLVDIIQYLTPYRNNFQKSWNVIKENTLRGIKYRDMLDSTYSEAELSSLFSGIIDQRDIYNQGWKFLNKTPGSGWNPDQVRRYSAGGFVSGPGTAKSDSISAMLSKGEFVMQASAVQAYGPGFMNALNQQQLAPRYAMQTASPQAAGAQIVYLSPEDRNLLRAAIDRPVNLYTENARIAQSANAGNVLLAQRGRN